MPNAERSLGCFPLQLATIRVDFDERVLILYVAVDLGTLRLVAEGVALESMVVRAGAHITFRHLQVRIPLIYSACHYWRHYDVHSGVFLCRPAVHLVQLHECLPLVLLAHLLLKLVEE